MPLVHSPRNSANPVASVSTDVPLVREFNIKDAVPDICEIVAVHVVLHAKLVVVHLVTSQSNGITRAAAGVVEAERWVGRVRKRSSVGWWVDLCLRLVCWACVSLPLIESWK